MQRCSAIRTDAASRILRNTTIHRPRRPMHRWPRSWRTGWRPRVSVLKATPYQPGPVRGRMTGWLDQEWPRDGAMSGMSRTCDSWKWSLRPRPGRGWWWSLAVECACWWRIGMRSSWRASSSSICDGQGGKEAAHDRVYRSAQDLPGSRAPGHAEALQLLLDGVDLRGAQL